MVGGIVDGGNEFFKVFARPNLHFGFLRAPFRFVDFGKAVFDPVPAFAPAEERAEKCSDIGEVFVGIKTFGARVPCVPQLVLPAVEGFFCEFLYFCVFKIGQYKFFKYFLLAVNGTRFILV